MTDRLQHPVISDAAAFLYIKFYLKEEHDTMRGRAGEYRTEAENVQNVIDKMDRLLDTLLTEWEGAASEAYANKFAELRPSFVKGKELIDDIAMALDKTAEAVESTDTQIANQFSM
jgi:WXG100 family type VII secretion target